MMQTGAGFAGRNRPSRSPISARAERPTMAGEPSLLLRPTWKTREPASQRDEQRRRFIISRFSPVLCPSFVGHCCCSYLAGSHFGDASRPALNASLASSLAGWLAGSPTRRLAPAGSREPQQQRPSFARGQIKIDEHFRRRRPQIRLFLPKVAASSRRASIPSERAGEPLSRSAPDAARLLIACWEPRRAASQPVNRAPNHHRPERVHTYIVWRRP